MGYVYWVVNPRRRPRADGSLLGQLEAAFRRLDQGDTLIALDLGRIGYPPLSFATMSAVRELLADPNLSYSQRDQLWRDLIYFGRRTDHQPDRGRRPGRNAHHPNTYQVAAIGLAMPGLRHAATRLSHQHPGDQEDIHTGLVTAFLARLAAIDLNQPNIAGRLIGGAASTVRRHLHQQ